MSPDIPGSRASNDPVAAAPGPRSQTAPSDPPPAAGLSITVLVPTYRRPDDLKRCLEAVAAQRRAADEIVVVAREDDRASWELIETMQARLPLRPVAVRIPGQVAALNAGLEHVRTDLVAITDDDAAPWPDWIERIVAHFASDPRIGGVGGRDHMYVGGVLQDGRASTVGKFHRLTKHVGNHHLGFGDPRPVDILKGANMSYRLSAVGRRRFDTRLRGTGAQVHNDLAFSVALREAGYTLIYDPNVAVDHFPAERFDDDQRNTFNAVATSNAVYNETLIRLGLLAPWERAVYAAWSVFVGTRVAPGLVQWVRFLPRNPRIATARLAVSYKGRYDAFRDTLVDGGKSTPGVSPGADNPRARSNGRRMPSLPSAVVFVSPDFPPAFGGIQRVTERLALVAHDTGVRVAVVAAKSDGYAAYDATLPFDVLRYDAGALPRTILPMAGLIRRAAKSISAQRIVALLFSPPGLATTVLRFGGMRTPVTVLAHGTDIAKQNSSLRRFALRMILRGTDVVANSSFTAGLLAQRGITGVRIVNPGADPVETLDLPRATVPTVLTAGRLVRRKGYDRVIEATARLLPQFPELQIVIVGDGPDRARLEQLATQLGVAGHVDFRGRVDDAELAACYSRAWCFAMPNRNEDHDVEGFGLVFLEAALHGVPSVGGRDSGADDAIVDGVTGYLVDGNDTTAVTGALEKLLSDPARAAAFGQAGRERALRDFSWERYTREMLTL